jgi:homoserine kinase
MKGKKKSKISLQKPLVKSAAAFAPASIGNVAVGFDVLGLSVPCLGDIVRVEKNQESKSFQKIKTKSKTKSKFQIEIKSIRGVVKNLPTDFRYNTATAAIAALLKRWNKPCNISVSIEKNIPLGSGLGGSAASAVAGVMAMNQLLGFPFSMVELFHFALKGEMVASGAAHPDNVAPSLYGGLVLASSQFTKPIIEVPLPKGIFAVVVHPEIQVKTKEARQMLKKEISLSQYVQQSALLAGFILACHSSDNFLLRDTLVDTLIEPQRAHLIPEFAQLKNKVLNHNEAIGFSISGSGPSVFAWVRGKSNAKNIATEIQKHFFNLKLESQAYVFQLSKKGAQNLR